MPLFDRTISLKRLPMQWVLEVDSGSASASGLQLELTDGMDIAQLKEGDKITVFVSRPTRGLRLLWVPHAQPAAAPLPPLTLAVGSGCGSAKDRIATLWSWTWWAYSLQTYRYWSA